MSTHLVPSYGVEAQNMVWDVDLLTWVKSTASGGPSSAVEVTNFPATQPVSASSLPLPAGAATESTLSAVNGKLPALDTGRVPVILPAGGSGLTDAELRASAVPVSGTFFQATQPVSGTFWQATQPVSAASLPLPSGAATSTAQGTGNSSLASIDGKLPAALEGGRLAVVLPAGGGGLTDSELRATPVEVSIKADDATFYVYVTPMALAANKLFLSILNTAAQVMRVRKLFLVNAALAAVTGVGVQWDIDKITAISGGTAVTPRPVDSLDTLTGVTCVHTATSVTKAFTWFSWFTNNDEIGLTGGFPQATIQSLGNLLPEGAKFKDLVLRQNEGVCVKQITSTVVGSYGVLVVLTRD